MCRVSFIHSDARSASEVVHDGVMKFSDLTNLHEVSFAIETAQLVGTVLLDRPETLEISTKSTKTDVVTHMDKLAERMIVQRIEEFRPLDGILAEEGASKESRSGLQWVIDPVDGTINYLYDLPFWCVSIALIQLETNEPLVGVVFAPALGEMFVASAGMGAWRISNHDAKQIHTSDTVELAQSLMGTGFGYAAKNRKLQADVLTYVLPRVRDIRRMGSCAIDLCEVASGRLDGFYEKGVNHWDYAAGALIVREAGGFVSGIDGNAEGSEMLLACAPGIHQEMLVLLETATRELNQ